MPEAPQASTPVEQGEVMGPPEPYGPPTPVAEPAYGPDPILIRPVTLVFGPGYARGFAFAGVIRALNEGKIPIAAMLGTGMGSLIGALYAHNGNINHFEWSLMKFKGEMFSPDKAIFSKIFDQAGSVTPLERQLNQSFEKKDIRDFKIPMRIAIQKEPDSIVIVDHGDAAAALRAALATPGLLVPGKWEGSPAMSAGKSLPLLIHEARALGLGPIIVLDSQEHNESDLKEADLVIRLDLTGITDADLGKRTDAAFRGKKAVNMRMAEIRQWVGLPKIPSGAGEGTVR